MSAFDYTIRFSAKRVTTELNWEEIVLDYQCASALQKTTCGCSIIRKECVDGGIWYADPGYQALFYEPLDTRKTSADTLIGKRFGMDICCIYLSIIVSKYIGETEKNLADFFTWCKTLIGYFLCRLRM